jgi:hypothetical protein
MTLLIGDRPAFGGARPSSETPTNSPKHRKKRIHIHFPRKIFQEIPRSVWPFSNANQNTAPNENFKGTTGEECGQGGSRHTADLSRAQRMTARRYDNY